MPFCVGSRDGTGRFIIEPDRYRYAHAVKYNIKGEKVNRGAGKLWERQKPWVLTSQAMRIYHWSGIRESNPCLNLGKVAFYH